MNDALVKAYLKLDPVIFKTTKELGVTIHQMRTLESLGLVTRTASALRPYEPHYGWRSLGGPRPASVHRDGRKARQFNMLLERAQSDKRKDLLGDGKEERAPGAPRRRRKASSVVEERTAERVQEGELAKALLSEIMIEVAFCLKKTPTQNLARDIAKLLLKPEYSPLALEKLLA